MFNLNFSDEELIRYSQQIKLPEIGPYGQNQLKQAKVLCVGLGGLGSPLLLYLGASGIGTLGLVDHDTVDLSNLHRQILYRTSHLGQEKVQAAKQQILALNPEIEVHTYCEKLSQDNVRELVSHYDIIADGSDNFYTRYLLHDTCYELEKPYVYASASQYQGYCSLFHGIQGPCLRCLFPTPAEVNACMTCTEGGVLGVLPGILGLIQATEIIKWIVNLGTCLQKRLLIVDILKMSFKEINVSQNPDCILCAPEHASERSEGSPEAIKDEQHIDINQLVTLLEQNPNTSLIDVRTPEEHAEFNIGGTLIPLDQLPYRLNELDKSRTIILYCRSGKRSLMAMNLLTKAGFSSVKHLKNGVMALAV